MHIDEVDQERWDLLPGADDHQSLDQASSEETVGFIDSIQIEGPVYSYASCIGPIQVQHESKKVRLPLTAVFVACWATEIL